MRRALTASILSLLSHLAFAAPVYNGGPLLVGDTTVNLIFYGWGPSAASVEPTFGSFIGNVGTSDWWGITREYFDSASRTPGGVRLGQIVTLDSLQFGVSLNQPVIESIARSGPAQGANTVNFVLTGPAIAVDGFGTANCGWHANHGSFLYGFIGDSALTRGCLDGQVQFHGDAAIGGMLSVLAHELTETVTDPYNLTGWREPGPQTASSGRENADMCAWQYSGVQRDGFGLFNQSFGGEHYLIQDNYLLVGATPHPNNCAHTFVPEAPKTINCPPHVICKPEVDTSVYVSPLIETAILDVQNPSAVPEPATIGMMLLGFAGAAVHLRRARPREPGRRARHREQGST